MKPRQDFDAALEIVGGVVRAWDPYCLIGSGAPACEFDAQIGRLVARLPSITSSAAAAVALSEIFAAAFEPSLFSPAQCAAPAEELFARLSAAGLAPQA